MKRIAIVGGGASGLMAIKCCLDEGLEPVCLERTAYLGGLWRFNSDVKSGQACVMKTTVINTSKEMMCFSDFPIPKEYPIFMHNSKIMDYFRLYANNFGLEKYIRYLQEAISVKQVDDFQESGRWVLEIKDHGSGKTSTETFDGVLMCTGHHAEEHMPEFEGAADFQGTIIHTHQYRDHKPFEDKRVVVIGIGNSGGDIAVDLSKLSKQVFLSTRRGSWVTNRVYDNGTPIDMVITRRSANMLLNKLGFGIGGKVMARKCNSRFDHARYGLQPEHSFFAQHPMVNDELPNRIICGTVVVKPNVKRFTKTGVEFDDGTFEDDIDAIVYATGYKFGFPIVKHPALEVKKNKVGLYKLAIPPDIQPPTLAVIGFIQPLGAIMPIAELQCRLATRLIKGTNMLPSVPEMWADIRHKEQLMAERYVQTQRHTIQVDWIPIMDELAQLVGCRPDLGKLFWSDPKLALECFFGPCTPYQYRLMGPGEWKGAREAIMSQWNRTYYPMETRKVPRDGTGVLSSVAMKIILLVFLAVILKWLITTVV